MFLLAGIVLTQYEHLQSTHLLICGMVALGGHAEPLTDGAL